MSVGEIVINTPNYKSASFPMFTGHSNHILTVELCRIFFIYSFFFQEKTLDDISFKLETKIMNFMSFFILKVANIRRFILIQCSEQEARFKKYVIML
jgi:hypothetical protein